MGNGQLIVPGTTVPAHVLAGDTFSAGSNYGAAGAMPNKGAVVITPSPNAQVIPAGYHNGSGSVPGVAVTAAHLLTGDNVAGTAGTMPNFTSTAQIATAVGQSGTQLRFQTPPGYYDATAVVASSDANWIPANIANGVSLFGKVGTLVAGTLVATGTGTPSGSIAFTNDAGTTVNQAALTVTGLTFTPSRIEIVYSGGSGGTAVIYDVSNTFGSNAATHILEVIGGVVTLVRIGGNAVVSSTGFTLPFNQSGLVVNWYAYQ